MPEKKLDHKRIANYVTGLLYYYGVIDFANLYRIVSDTLPGNLDRADFRAVLDKELDDEESPIDFDEGLYCHIDVEAGDWLRKELELRDAIPYRPVTEKEAQLVVSEQFHLLWDAPENLLYRTLIDRYDFPKEGAVDMILLAQDMYRNNVHPMSLIHLFLDKIEFNTKDEFQPFRDMVMNMLNHTPCWYLKGWTANEVRDRFIKRPPKPMPENPFSNKKEEQAKQKVGRNEPCPCGSGRKFKKCCGAPVPEEEIKAAAPSRKIPERVEPTLEEWRALYEAAVDFKQSCFWEWMYNKDLFGVMDPETGEVAYLCIMGWLGEYFALGAYLGSEGLDVALDMLSEPALTSPDWLMRLKMLKASFEDRENLADQDRAVIKELGLRFRGKNQWPLFRSYEPGLFPWFISAWECRFLTQILLQAREVALRCRRDKSILDHPEPRTFLVRVPRKEGGAVAWDDQYLKVACPVKKYPSFEITDELRLRKVRTSLKKGRGTWEADIFWLPTPVREDKGDRPYFPKAFILLDRSSCLILGHTTLANPFEDGYKCIDVIIGQVSDKGVPSRIVVDGDETYNMLKKACRQLDIPLEKVDQLEVVPEVRKVIFNEDNAR